MGKHHAATVPKPTQCKFSNPLGMEAAMSIPGEVLTVQGRIATFQQPHQLSKRRASNAKKKATTTLSWPHAAPLPEDFARAGFFYRPTTDAPDNVQCFSCLRQLDGWEPNDDPVLEHITHVPDCGWAINVCIGQRCNADPDNVAEEDPMTDRLVEARAKTFHAGSGWPHEEKKGWKCKVKKMVEAGWCYDPGPEADDGVTCFYCKLSLDGWEPKDDPLVEHRKRSADCPFFALLDQYADLHKKPPKNKSRRSRASKASTRLSTQSDVFSEAPSLASVMDTTAQLDDSVLSAATAASVPRKRKATGKSKPVATTTKKSTRRKKLDLEAEEESVVLYPTISMSLDHTVEASQLSTDLPKRSTRIRTNGGDVSQSVTSFSQNSSPNRATRTRGLKKKVEESVLTEDASQLQSQLQAAVDLSLGSLVPDDESTPKAGRRGVKRSSDGKAKLDSSVLFSEETNKPKKAAGRPKKGTRQTKEAEASHPDSSIPPALDSQTSLQVDGKSASKPAPKAKRGKKTQKMALAQPTTAENGADLFTLDDFPAPPSQLEPSPPRIHQDQVSALETPRSVAQSPSPAPSTPTPIKSKSVGGSGARSKISEEVPASQHTGTPAPNSPSSDAENAPPSSIPASARPPLVPISANKHTAQIPLASTPERSKQNGIITSIPWSAVDLENIFVPSPASKAVFSPLSVLNRGLPDVEAIERDQLKEIMNQVRDGLSETEKSLTVGQWIAWNADQSESKLRTECERLVNVFEREGVKALRVLEGIVVAAE